MVDDLIIPPNNKTDFSNLTGGQDIYTATAAFSICLERLVPDEAD